MVSNVCSPDIVGKVNWLCKNLLVFVSIRVDLPDNYDGIQKTNRRKRSDPSSLEKHLLYKDSVGVRGEKG